MVGFPVPLHSRRRAYLVIAGPVFTQVNGKWPLVAALLGLPLQARLQARQGHPAPPGRGIGHGAGAATADDRPGLAAPLLRPPLNGGVEGPPGLPHQARPGADLPQA